MITLIKPAATADGVAVQVHAIARCEIGPDADAILVHTASWANEGMRAAGKDPVARAVARIPLADLPTCAAVMDELVTLLTASGWLQGAQRVQSSAPSQLLHARALARARVQAAWAAADQGTFEHAGKTISCDSASRGRIDAVNGHVLNSSALPAGWPGGWRAVDNTLLPIADVAAWRAFHAAMVAKGLANFARSQELKSQIEAEESIGALMALQADFSGTPAGGGG